MGSSNGKSRQVNSSDSSDEFEPIEFTCLGFPKENGLPPSFCDVIDATPETTLISTNEPDNQNNLQNHCSLIMDDVVTKTNVVYISKKAEMLPLRSVADEREEPRLEDEIKDEVDEGSEESDEGEGLFSFGNTSICNSQINSQFVTVGNTVNIGKCKSLEESMKWESVKPGLKENLTSKLKTRWKQIANRMLVPEDFGRTIEIDDCPVVTIQEENSMDQTSRLITDTEDFVNRCESRNLVEGQASYGKTIYAKKITSAWANCVNCGNCSGKLSQFDFVFLVQSEDVVPSSDFWDILFRQGKLENTSRESFQKFINEEQKRVLIIVDSAEFADLTNLINLVILPQSTVVVFSRPYVLDPLKKLFVKTFSVYGFQEEQISHYSNLFGPETKKKVKRLFRSESESMIKSPFYLHLLCVTAKNENELQICKSTTKVFCSLFSRAISRVFPEMKVDKLINVEFLINFGKICYSSVLSRTKGSSEIFCPEIDDDICAKIGNCRWVDLNCGSNNFPIEEFPKSGRDQTQENGEVSFYRSLTKISAKAQKIKMCDFREILSLDLISRCNNSGNEIYRANHQICIDFLIALYLSRNVDSVDFPVLIRRFLSQQVNSLTLKFILGLIPEKFVHIFQYLPLHLSSNWSLDWIFILGESGILNDADISIPKFPEDLNLKLRRFIVTIPNKKLDLHKVENRVVVQINDKSEHVLTIKRYLRDICRHGSKPIRRLKLDCDNSTETLGFVIEFIAGLDEDGVKFDSVFFRAHVYDNALGDIVGILVNMTKKLKINVDSWEFDDRCKTKIERNNYVLENFEIDINSTSNVFDLDRFNSLKEILTSCKLLKNFKISPVDIDKMLFLEICSLNLVYLTLKPKGDEVRSRGFPGRRSIRKLPLHGSSTNFRVILNDILNSKLTYLDISGLLIDKLTLKNIFRELSRNVCQIKTLILAYCHSPDNSLNSVDLSELVTPNRELDVVDLSGWVIFLSNEVHVVTVKTLIVHDADIRDNNLLEMCSKLKVDKLKCDRQHLIDTVDDTPNSLSILKLKNISEERSLANLLRIASRMSGLSKIKLECKIEDFDGDSFAVLDSLKMLPKLECVHLVLKLSKRADSNLSSTLSTFFKAVNLMFFEEKIVQSVKLTLDFGAICVWKKYDGLREIFDSVENAFRQDFLCSLCVTQSVESLDIFLKNLDSWCVDKNPLPFNAQLRHKSSLTSKTIDFTVSQH